MKCINKKYFYLYSREPEPAILPTGNPLRILIHYTNEVKKRHNDVLTTLPLMRQEVYFKHIFHNMEIIFFFYTIIVKNKCMFIETIVGMYNTLD